MTHRLPSRNIDVYKRQLLYVLFTLLGPVLIGRAIDQVFGPGNVNYQGVVFYLALLAVTVLLAAAFQWVLNVCTRNVSAWAANDLRRDAFAVLNRVPLKYIDGHSHGDIISRMVNDAELVAEGLLQGLTQLLPGVATILGTLCVMAVLNPFIALVVEMCIRDRVGAVTQALNGAAADAGATAQNAVTGAASNAAGSVKEQCKAAVQAAMDADGTLTPEQQTAILAALDSVGGYDASQDAAAANGAVQQAVGAQAQTVQQVLAPLAGLDTTALKGSFGTVRCV